MTTLHSCYCLLVSVIIERRCTYMVMSDCDDIFWTLSWTCKKKKENPALYLWKKIRTQNKHWQSGSDSLTACWCMMKCKQACQNHLSHISDKTLPLTLKQSKNTISQVSWKKPAETKLSHYRCWTWASLCEGVMIHVVFLYNTQMNICYFLSILYISIQLWRTSNYFYSITILNYNSEVAIVCIFFAESDLKTYEQIHCYTVSYSKKPFCIQTA